MQHLLTCSRVDLEAGGVAVVVVMVSSTPSGVAVVLVMVVTVIRLQGHVEASPPVVLWPVV